MTTIDLELAGIRLDPVIQVSDLQGHVGLPVMIGDRQVWDTWQDHPAPIAERMTVQDEGQLDP